MEYTNGDYIISTDPMRLDIEVIHSYLSRSYWATGRTKEAVVKSLQHSLNFGVYLGSAQIGLARVISDYTTFAYVADVFILEEHRGAGLGKWLISVVTLHPEISGLRRVVLATRDAHELYRQYGFTELVAPERWMEKFQQ